MLIYTDMHKLNTYKLIQLTSLCTDNHDAVTKDKMDWHVDEIEGLFDQ